MSPNHLCGHVPMCVTRLPSFGPVSPGTTAIGPAVRHLSEVLDLIGQVTVLTKTGVFYNFCFIKFSHKHTVQAAWTTRTTLWPPPPRWWGPTCPNLAKIAPGVELLLLGHLI